MPNQFDLKVQQQIARLQQSPCRVIEAEVAQKRVAWLREHHPTVDRRERLSPCRAYEMLFFEYMGLSAADLPVISETETEIVWRSENPCPTLTAVQELHLDTRHVCRAAYEKSTQAFVSYLDPQLRFLRSYQEIRPYACYCKEMIVRVDFEALMQKAIAQAGLSRQEGNKGYGAVVALGNRILGEAHDTAITERDPSLHAEVNAIRQAVRTIGDGNLGGAILVSTCEPCPMCSSLAVWANLTSIVYGVSIEETVQLGKARIRVSANEIVQKSPVMLEVIGGVCNAECKVLYE